jgi:hypothetical protein
MSDLQHVSIIGPRGSEPDSGRRTWLTFVQEDETAAANLAQGIVLKFSDALGRNFTYHIEPIPLTHGNHEELWSIVEEIIADGAPI